MRKSRLYPFISASCPLAVCSVPPPSLFLTRSERLRYNQFMSEINLEIVTTSPTRVSLLDLSLAELTDYVQGWGHPAYRARQVWDWIYKRYARSFDEMSNLPKPLRERLNAEAVISPLSVATRVLSLAGDTQKVLFRLADGQTIETVLMLYDKRRTLCISSQAGCAMGCTFCATAQGGLARNLSVGEIVDQVLYFAHYLAHADLEPSMQLERPTTVTNVVLMGMGEPMHNYNNVWTALRRLTDNDAFGLGRATLP